MQGKATTLFFIFFISAFSGFIALETACNTQQSSTESSLTPPLNKSHIINSINIAHVGAIDKGVLIIENKGNTTLENMRLTITPKRLILIENESRWLTHDVMSIPGWLFIQKIEPGERVNFTVKVIPREIREEEKAYIKMEVSYEDIKLFEMKGLALFRSDITREEATSIATDYLKEKGVIPHGNITDAHGIYDIYYDAFVWQIEFNNTRVWIHSASGDVVRYFNSTTPGSIDVKITPEQAREIAEAFVEPPTTAKFRGVKLRDYKNFKEYRVVWGREFNGYLCEETYGDNMWASVNPLSGEVVAYGKSWVMQSPASLEAKLSKEQAIKQAKQSLGNRLPANAYVASAELRVVRPNHYWTGERLTMESKLAWVIRFEYKDGLFTLGRHFKEVWVDVTAGENVGGVASL